jgi:endoplasmic reticulum-Golgi intermediate compartment protein 2
MNLDVVVAMQCKDLHVNVQDAAGDRILAGDLLTRHETNWQLWTDKLNKRRRGNKQAYQLLHEENPARMQAEEEDQHVGHVLGHIREGGKKFSKTPKLRRGESADSCRIFGSLEGNKVQGDFHITARGHGYMEFGYQKHLDHTSRCRQLITKQSVH